jgi:hypothetical protein
LISTLVGFYTWRITQERNQAQLEAEKSRQITEYIKEIFRVSDPIEAQIQVRDLNAIQLLNNGLKRVNNQESQPAVQSELMIVILDVFFRNWRIPNRRLTAPGFPVYPEITIWRILS